MPVVLQEKSKFFNLKAGLVSLVWTNFPSPGLTHSLWLCSDLGFKLSLERKRFKYHINFLRRNTTVIIKIKKEKMGGAETSWLVRSTSDRAVRVRTLVWDIALCSWVYKWVPANLMRGVTLRWTSIPSRGGIEIILVASCYGNRR